MWDSPNANPFAPSPFHHHFDGSYKPNSNHHPQSWEVSDGFWQPGFHDDYGNGITLQSIEASKAGPKFPGKEQLLTFIEVPRSEMTG
jgi:hypothetical protein